MGAVVSLTEWRRSRGESDAMPTLGPDWEPVELGRLDRAIMRLDAMIAGRSGRPRRRSPAAEAAIETDLLAIMGALALGDVGQAAGRAERLAGQLDPKGSG
jgi:hypothetical protein